jgi:hypothetical protein
MGPTGPVNPGITLAQRLNPAIAVSDALTAKVMRLLRVGVPAVVVAPQNGGMAFNSGPPATVSLMLATNEYTESSQQQGPLSLSTKPQQIYLLGVPVRFPSAGGWSITFPIQEGDECWVSFADSSTSSWWQNGPPDSSSGSKNNPINPRRHSLSDAVASFDIRSTPNGLPNYSVASMQIRNNDGSVVIDLTADQATITAPKVVVNTTGDTDINAGSQVTVASPSIVLGGNVSCANGATGSFTTPTGNTVMVQDGIITNIY